MATLLLIVIFLSFIGLGIPDSLFGAAWPAIYPEFDLPVSLASAVTLLMFACTVVSSLVSSRVINRLGVGSVTLFSTALTAAGLLGFAFAGSFWWLCLLAVPLGLGAGAIDTGLNNFVALHYNATHMSFLHCFYGVGVSVSPFLMSLALADNNNWRGGYQLAFYLQLGITAAVLLALPLWGRIQKKTAEEEAVAPRNLTLKEMTHDPAIRAVWGLFICSVAIEYTCGTWGSTFLVNAHGFTAEAAARLVTVYYVGMTLGRFLSGLLATRLTPWRLIQWGQALVAVAILLLAIPTATTAGIGLFLVGLGNGPFFPNIVYLTPRNFGADVSGAVMGTQFAASYVGTMSMPPLFGLLADRMGASVFPGFLAVLFAGLIFCMIRIVRVLKQRGRYE